MIPIAICADDYGIAPGVDAGILELAADGRITALSCMTALPRWLDAAKALQPFFGCIDIGLHFTLTQVAPLGAMPRLAPIGRFPSMRRIYAQALLRTLDIAEIEAELARQTEAFRAATGREPDFLDGHHHVHQLGPVREAVARQWQARSGWVRNTATPFWRLRARGVAVRRAAILSAYGRLAQRTWRVHGIATNTDFAGVRDFAATDSFRTLMQRYLQDAVPGLVIMCHPGRPDDELARIDYVTAPRADELAYLSGPDFPADLEAAKCALVRPSLLFSHRRA
jgi:predicted glycoside hydrolase/deacetylase ChbG (UPF0249 family)